MNTARAAVPLTTAGYVVAVLCLAAYVGGWQLGWVELMVVAAGCLLALVIAVPFVIGRIRLDLRRTLAPQRVTAGERAVAVLTVANNGRAPSRPMTVEDRVGSRLAADRGRWPRSRARRIPTPMSCRPSAAVCSRSARR